MVIVKARIFNATGIKSEIEVIEYKKLEDAYKVIAELIKEVEKLNEQIKKLKDGTVNG